LPPGPALSSSGPWYESLLDAEPVLDEDTDPDFHHTVYLLGNGTLLGLHQHGTPAPGDAFSEHRVGLDHVAFGCADRAELAKWADRLNDPRIVHRRIKDATYPPRRLRPVAFGCADRAELAKWAARLTDLGIVNGGIKDAPYGSGVSFRDPD